MEVKDGIVTKITNEDVVDGSLVFPDDAIVIKNTDVSELDSKNITKTVNFNNIEEIVSFRFVTDYITQSARCVCKHAEIVRIPKLQMIMSEQFSNCDIKEVYLGTTEVIGNKAFYYCTRLTKVFMGNSLKTIENGAFIGTKALKAVDIPESIVYIRAQAFFESGIKSVSIKGSPEIDATAFRNCPNLKRIMLHSYDSKRIKISAFLECAELSDIVVFTKISEKTKMPYIGHGQIYTVLECYNGVRNKTMFINIIDDKTLKTETMKIIQTIDVNGTMIYIVQNNNYIIKSGDDIKVMNKEEFFKLMRKEGI